MVKCPNSANHRDHSDVVALLADECQCRICGRRFQANAPAVTVPEDEQFRVGNLADLQRFEG